MSAGGSKRERNKADRRDRILAAAVALFYQRGYRATTYEAIARRAAVSRGTVFNYYPYKEALLVALMAGELDALKRRIARLAPGSLGGPTAEIAFVFEELAGFVESHRDLVLPLSYELLSPDPERSRAAYLALPLAEMLRAALVRAREIGELRTDFTPERLARSLANSYFLTVLQWAAYRQDRSIRDELRAALKIGLEGILAR